MDKSIKRRWGDRRDGRWVRDVPGLTTIMMHIMPRRTAAEVYVNEKIDATELVKYIERKNAEHPDYRTTLFHCFIVAIARMIHERPKMNRFIQGRRMYERYEISIGFVAKRRFADNAEEALMFYVPKEDDTLDTLSRKIAGDVKETKKSATSTGGIDATVDAFAKIPRILLMAVIRIIRWLDFYPLARFLGRQSQGAHGRGHELLHRPAHESRQHQRPRRVSSSERLRHEQHRRRHRHAPQGGDGHARRSQGDSRRGGARLHAR